MGPGVNRLSIVFAARCSAEKVQCSCWLNNSPSPNFRFILEFGMVVRFIDANRRTRKHRVPRAVLGRALRSACMHDIDARP